MQIFSVIIGGGFLLLFLQLAYVQIFAGSEFRALSDKNSIRLLRLTAPRGLVYDRRGNLLIDNRRSFTVSIIPAETSDPAAVIGKLKQFISFDEQVVMAKLLASKSAPFSQIPVAFDVSIEQVAPIEEFSLDLPGTIITAEPCRRFLLNDKAAHVLGYLGEIDQQQLERWSDKGYALGDYVGKSGLEYTAEEWLHGESGGMQVQVYSDGQPQIELDERGDPRVRIDTAGRELITLGMKTPEAGDILHLTLDLDIQQAAEQAMGDFDGAVVVMDARTGAIRAMVSRPSFDPNIFVSSGKNIERADVLTNSRKPLLNRVLQAYSPGSTFKIVMAYAALCEGVVTPEKTYSCSGSFTLGRTFRCWKDKVGHGRMDIIHGLAYSCDVFFYNVGLQLGIERIDRYARQLGLGELTGIELTGEMKGLIPSPAWKEKAFKYDKKWYDGETVNAAIGQGYTLVTPLQMTRLMAAIVNGGNLMTPYLVDRVTTPGADQVVFQRAPTAEHALANTEALAIIHEALKQAVESRSPFFGTAWRAMNEKIVIIGKTGTAQVVGFRERADTAEKLEHIPYEQRDHAWFLAAMDTPEGPLVMLVFCEHSGHASESAVLVGREIAMRIADLTGLTPADQKQDGQTI